MTEKATIKTCGMSCAACSARIDKAVGAMDGVESVNADFSGNTVNVEFDSDKIAVDDVKAAIRRLGYQVIESDSGDIQRKESESLKKGLIVSAIATAVLMIFAMGPMFGIKVPFQDNRLAYSMIQLALCVPVVVSGRRFYIRGIPALLRGGPTMDTLVAVGTIAALTYSLYATFAAGSSCSLFYDSAAMIITLVSTGKLMEARSKVRTDDALKGLAAMAPLSATIEKDGATVVVSASEIKVGDIMVIRPGERIPADGRIIEGETHVDESMLTGESMPVSKSVESSLYCGTVNSSGGVRAEVTGIGDDTALSRIMQMVREARSTKAPVARMADRVAARFVPSVMIVAAVSAIAWYFSGKGAEFSLITFISVLVISCPCALGLATPMAITVGTGRAAEFGILFKNAAALERAGRITDVILDKTGTLTEGKPKVTAVFTTMNETEFIRYFATAESMSEHPLAKAVMEYSESKGISPMHPSGFRAIAGRGILCTVEGFSVTIGNDAFMEECGISILESESEESGSTRVHMALGRAYAGRILISDPVREESAESVKLLRDMGLKITMVTGDSGSVADAVASEIGIDNVIHSALPEDKVKAVKIRQASGADVAVAGDGINDSPALTQADLGIAVASGTDIAIESADVVLLNDDVRSIPSAIHFGRSVLRNIKQNLFFAFCYNIICIPIAAGLPVLFGMGEFMEMPMIAALAMSLSSVSVVSNALRLRTIKPFSAKK